MTGLEESLILLLATAGLSGVLVPFILNRVQVRSQQRQKTFEADLARQTKVIEDQVALIERLSTVLWEFQLKLIAPLYYGQRPFLDIQIDELGAYQEAAKKYLSEAGRLLGLIRTEIGKAVRLVPRESWLNLRSLYYEKLLPLDLEVTKLISSGPINVDSRSWHAVQSYAVHELAEIVDTTFDELAEALQLKYHKDVDPEVHRRASAARTQSKVMTRPQDPDLRAGT